MDDLREWELENIISELENVDKNAWERTRTLCYLIAQTNSTKRLKPQDIMKFPWETEKEQKEIERQKSTIKLKKEITKEEIEMLQKKALEIQNKYF